MTATVVLISGKQGSGKTTVQTALNLKLRELGYKSERLNFADPIYAIHDAIRRTAGEFGLPPTMPKDGLLMQLIGTNWARDVYGPDVWMSIVKNRIHDFPSEAIVIVGDCRFENEFDAFPDAITVRLNCSVPTRRRRCSKWRENTGHESEVGLDAYVCRNKFKFNFCTDDGHSVDEIIETLETAVRCYRGNP